MKYLTCSRELVQLAIGISESVEPTKSCAMEIYACQMSEDITVVVSIGLWKF